MASYGGLSSGALILPRLSNSVPISSSSSPSIGRRRQALKVHSEAERRRRERINAHLSTLRSMVPDASTNKMDKASLLGRVIDHVKDLKRKAAETSKSFSIPTEANEVIVELARELHDTTISDNNNFFFHIKASVCCEDRPDLFMSLMKTFHGLMLRAIRAEITSLGGRVKIVFILCGRDDENGNGGVVCMSSLKDALARIASFDMVTMDASLSKRQRLLQSYYSSISV